MTVLGIDLGTSNSACYAWRDGELINIPNRLAKTLTPSVVGIDKDGHVMVGETAKHRLIRWPDDTVAVFKRLMGTDASIHIGKQKFTAPELSSLVLRSLKEDAEAFLNTEITDAVVSVPAYFNENQRLATKQAAKLAGLRVNRLINEPTAAAMAYGLNQRQQGTFMILDMGGGTFDVSILEYFSGVMEVHASAGDNFLGGEDILEAMFDEICVHLKIKRAEFTSEQTQILMTKLEAFKRSVKLAYEESIDILYADKRSSMVLTHEWFLSLVTPLLLRAKLPIQRALSDARLQASDIDDVILVGGSTRLQAFRQMIAQIFGRLPSCHLDPDLVVAMGAGIQAGLIEQNEALDDIVLTDVCPYTLGTEVVNENNEPGYFYPIIERNTVVPVSIEREVFTVQDYQKELKVKVFQGEHRLVKNNVFLGSIDVQVPKAKKGEEGVSIRYSYDMNGLLDVDCKVISSGKVYSKTIQNAPGMLSEEALTKAKQALAKIKFHPRDSESVRNVIARAERVYSMLIGDERQHVGNVMAKFDSIVEGQNHTQITRALEEVNAILDRYDNREWF